MGKFIKYKQKEQRNVAYIHYHLKDMLSKKKKRKEKITEKKK